LIDADHYLWFCAQQHCLDPLAAVRFFNQANAPQHQPARLLHHPVAVLALLLLGCRARCVLPVAAGMRCTCSSICTARGE
jgi:hypothetical protein